MPRLAEMPRGRRGRADRALRAKMGLRCAAGLTPRAVAAERGVTEGAVLRRRDRFIGGGSAALGGRPRTGRPATRGKESAAAVPARLAQPPPAGFGQWDGALRQVRQAPWSARPMPAKEPGCSKRAVWRPLGGQGTGLARKGSRCVGADPEPAAKAADVAGPRLYMDGGRAPRGHGQPRHPQGARSLARRAPRRLLPLRPHRREPAEHGRDVAAPPRRKGPAGGDPRGRGGAGSGGRRGLQRGPWPIRLEEAGRRGGRRGPCGEVADAG
jgi:hypothetical protein